MAQSYRGAIGFGLVYIPITLHASSRESEVGFHMLERKTLSRVKYQKTCTDCNNKIIQNSDIVKGFEVEKGQYVTFENEEIEKLKTKKDKNIMIEKFVDQSEISPIYYDKTYYVCPENGSAEKAYFLLKTVLSKTKKAGISKTVLGTNECVVMLWVEGENMMLTRLFFAEEVQKNPAANVKPKVSEKEVTLAENIIKVMEGKFDPKEYQDEFTKKVKKAIKAKAAGIETKEEEEDAPKVTDLLAALQKSVKLVAKRGN